MSQSVFPLDPMGSDLTAEAATLRRLGPIAQVELPGGVRASSVTRHEQIKRLLTDPRVWKDPRCHRPAFRSGEITPDWPLYPWVSVENMLTAYGAEHSRLRRLVAGAFTARRSKSTVSEPYETGKPLIFRAAATRSVSYSYVARGVSSTAPKFREVGRPRGS
ncbi:hypothetical protein [Streptomyces sp. NPDC007369]|uniref:hypothetical protein n=1 Tax=Streptomyces sp. NPDC007369 TaxID=3154589 RepID=UPI0034111BD1